LVVSARPQRPVDEARELQTVDPYKRATSVRESRVLLRPGN
jgi:hypothetical protein